MKIAQDIILNVSKSLIRRLSELDKNQFGLSENTKIDSVIDQQYSIFLRRFDSRIFFGSEAEYGIPNDLEYLSLNIIKVIANLTDETKKYGNNVSFLQLQKSLNRCLEKTKVPGWLHEKLCNHLPPLFIKEFTRSISGDDGKSGSNKYFIYLKAGKIIECDKKELDKFCRKSKIEKYDIYMEHTDNYNILIKNNPHVFMAGEYHPFSILSLLLQRMGKSVSYNEIYHLAIKPLENKRPRDRSKKVYDYLKYINNAIGKVKNLNQSPEIWFLRDHKKGLIHVSNNINACLIISVDNLAG